jgi:predicted ABC-type ATPase
MPERFGAERPVCRIIAGTNGAGRTTFALRYLPRVAPGTAFVNDDLIAAGLSPVARERQLVAASRLFLREIERHLADRTSFAFETTLSGRAYPRLVHRLKEAAWRSRGRRAQYSTSACTIIS